MTCTGENFYYIILCMVVHVTKFEIEHRTVGSKQRGQDFHDICNVIFYSRASNSRYDVNFHGLSLIKDSV